MFCPGDNQCILEVGRRGGPCEWLLKRKRQPAVSQDQKQKPCAWREAGGFALALLLAGSVAYGETVMVAKYFGDLATARNGHPQLEVIPFDVHSVSAGYPL
jgi:hypothetical protein